MYLGKYTHTYALLTGYQTELSPDKNSFHTNTRYFTWSDIVDLHDSNVSEKLLLTKLVREDRNLGNKKFYDGLKPSALGINHI